MQPIKTNSLKAWILASRPKTLIGAIVPVMVALSLAWNTLHAMVWIPAILCILFALVMQINANFINDYYDCLKGVDTAERLGPKRACAQGWISLPVMKRGIILTSCLASFIGLPLIYWGGLLMIWIGIACLVFCFLYTFVLSRIGLGDVLVVVFFGLVPVCVTYYIQTSQLPSHVWQLALACGLFTDGLLIVNNYRDRETDLQAHKRTLVTLIGARATEWLYFILGFVAITIAYDVFYDADYSRVLFLAVLVFHLRAWTHMKRIQSGSQLNKILDYTACNILFFGIALCIVILFA